jgi:protein O-GlcNAc transferase
MNKSAANARRRLAEAFAHFHGGRADEARASCAAALAADARIPEAWHLRGVLEARAGKHEAAIESFARALALGAHHPDLYTCVAASQMERAEPRLGEAEAALMKALEIDPRHAAANNSLGNLRVIQGRIGDAIRAYDAALVANPQIANALKGLSNLLLQTRHHEKAALLAQRLTKVDPQSPDGWVVIAKVAEHNQAWKGMLTALDEALARSPNDPHLIDGKIKCLSRLARYGEAVALAATMPETYRETDDFRRILAQWLSVQGDNEAALQTIETIDRKTLFETDAGPQRLFMLNYSAARDARAIIDAHFEWGADLARRHPAQAWPNVADDPERRLRVGLLSGDYRSHSVAFFVEPLLRAYDRERLEVFCYQANSLADSLTERLRKLPDAWRLVANLDDSALYNLMQRDRIDVLVDLAGHSSLNRLAVMALHPAPVQVTYLGYPNTTGLAAVQYRLTDARADPPDCPLPSAEEIVRLPDCFHCYQGEDSLPLAAESAFARHGCITFASFNNSAKINPLVLDAWARILRAVPGARMLIKAPSLGDPQARAKLVAQFAERGIDAARLSLHARLDDHKAHFALYHETDLALDTFPYNGTTTTCEALWMGIPVVTFDGDRHAARVGVSLLTAAGHPELVGRDVDDYVRIAVELAGDRERLARYHRRLREDLRASPLMDAPRFARHFEAALREMWRHHCRSRETFCRPFDFGDALTVEIGDGLGVTVPRALDRLTPWVLLEQERWFEDEFDFVRRYLQPGMQMIDVGANYGLYALTAAQRVGPGGRVFAFEPTGATRAHLAASAAGNGFHWLECRAEAVSDTPGEMRIEIHDNPELNRVIDDPAKVENFERIAVTTLDALFAERAGCRPDFIKIDAEGFEAAVLRGASRLLAGSEPLLMFEIKHGNEVHLELLDQAKRLGFATWRLVPGLGFLTPTPDDLSTLDSYTLNVFAGRPALAARLAEQGWLAAGALPSARPGTPAACIEAFHRALDPALAADARLAAARGALEGLRRAATGHADALTLSSLARVAAALGERVLAVEALARALDPATPQGDARAASLPPGERFDTIALAHPPAEWLRCALVERFVALQSFSGYFDHSGRQLQLLDSVCGNPFFSPEMARRRQLLRLRSGLQTALECEPLLATRSDRHRNPEVWCPDGAPAGPSPTAAGRSGD